MDWLLVFSLVAIVLGSLSLLISVVSLAMVVGLRNSTHSTQFVPLDYKDAGLEKYEPQANTELVDEDLEKTINGLFNPIGE